MITPELLEYIKNERLKNVPDVNIKSGLTANGWDENNITEAFATLAAPVGFDIGIGGGQTKNNEVDLKKFRKNRMYLIFSGWFFFEIAMALISGGAYSLGLGADPLTIACSIPVIFVGAFIVTRGMTPKGVVWKDTLDLALRFIGAFGIILVLGFAVLFAACLFMVSSSGSSF